MLGHLQSKNLETLNMNPGIPNFSSPAGGSLSNRLWDDLEFIDYRWRGPETLIRYDTTRLCHVVPEYLRFSQQHNNIYINIYTHSNESPWHVAVQTVAWNLSQHSESWWLYFYEMKGENSETHTTKLPFGHQIWFAGKSSLVGGLEHFLFSIQLGRIIPTDVHIFQMASYTTKQFHFVWFSQPEAFMYVLDVPMIFPWFSHVLQGKSCRRRSWANWMREVGPWEWGAGGFKENTAFTCIYHPVDIQKDVENHGNPS